MRRRWRDKADDIANNEQREISFHDLGKFVDAKAPAMAHPVFGDIKDDPRVGRKDSKGSTNGRGANFAASGNDRGLPGVNNKKPDSCNASTVPQSVLFAMAIKSYSAANTSRSFTWSTDFSSFVQRVSVNCLVPGHFVRECPKSSFCKISGYQSKHSTYPHLQRNAREPGEISPRENTDEHKVSVPDSNAPK